MAAAARQRGTVKWFNDTKGFGFISPEDGSEDLFVHQSSIKSEGFRSLAEGEEVEFSVTEGDDGRTKAVDVTGPDGSFVKGGSGGGGGGFGSRGGAGSGGGGRSYGGSWGGGRRSGAGVGAGACYKCGEPGHMARDCPSADGGGGYGGGGGGGSGCFKCGEPGHIARDRRRALAGGAVLASALLLVATPRLRHSPALHLFADMRNLLGVPNTLNVLTAYPLLLAGVPGLILCLCGSGCFGVSLRWEALGWFLFYAGNAAAAFGSAYYHLKPDDDRLIWDRLPMMISSSSLLSILVIERVDERVGLSCLISLLSLILVSSACERVLDDMRLWVILNFVPCIAIPAILFLFPPKYTHSRFWFLATGFYLLARFEGLADRKVYSVNRYFISGHSLEHLCFAMVTLILTVMLSFRNIKISRDS